MTDTIVCTAIRQPTAFFAGAPGSSLVINLNFDCRIPESNPKGRFQAFLKELPAATFRVYRLAFDPALPQPPTPSPLPYPTWPLQPTTFAASMANTPSGATPVDNIMNWLERRGEPSDGTPAPPGYWQSVNAAPVAATVKLGELRATHHLGTAFAWPAPLPQSSGLVRAVTLTPPAPQTEHLLVVVPFFNGAPANFQPTHVSSANGVVNFTYNAGTQFPAALAEIRVIDDPISVASSLIDQDNGFLVAPDPIDSDRVTTILQRVENRSASLLWAFPPIHAIAWPASDEPSIGRLVWRAMSGIATLLDPIILSLAPPPPPVPGPSLSVQQGPFVSALAACVQDAWVQSNSAGPAPTTSGIAKFVSDGLQAKLSLRESDTAQRSALIALIARLFRLDISPTKLTATTATGLIPLLLEAYAQQQPDQLTEPGWFKDAKNRFGSLEVTLSNELGALAQQLQANDGIEALIPELFEEIGLFDKSGNTGGALAIAPCTQPAIGDKIAKDATGSFRAFLNANFNALDATRHAQARLYELHLVAVASAGKPKPPGGVAVRWTSNDLASAITGAHWFARRIDPTKEGTFNAIARILPIYASAALTAADRRTLVGPPGPSSAGTLEASFELVCQEILATATERRFLPDHAPGTLQIQIAVDSDASDLDNFSQAYSGIGVLLRRAGNNWAYGDIADLDIYQMYDAQKQTDQYQPVVDPARPQNKLITVLPLQTVAIDGQRRLFVDYDGHPFASQAFVGTSAANGQAAFYRFEDPPAELLNVAASVPAPALAYGADYEAAAFVVGKGGSLPFSIQVDHLVPWLPTNLPHIPPPAGGEMYSRVFQYRRRTAIGRTSLTELPRPGAAKRIGVGIDDVQPLFRDHPRIGISSPLNGSAVLDILRNADGTGAFSLPKVGETAQLSLADLWWWGVAGASGGTLTLSFFSEPGPKPETARNRSPADDPILAIDVPIASARAGDSMVIGIASEVDTAHPRAVNLCFSVQFSGQTITQPPVNVSTSIQSIWLRVKIAASDPTKTVSLSLADPTAGVGGDHATSHPTPDSLLLIAPVGASEWRSPYTDAVSAEVLLPRVGLKDLDRWLSNSSLAMEAAPAVRGQPPTTNESLQLSTFFSTLMAAYIVRKNDARIGPLLERLPDLAVEQILVELTPLDALFDEPAKVTSYQPATLMGTISTVVPLRTLGARVKSPILPYGVDDLQHVVENLMALSDSCAIGLSIRSDDGELRVAVANDSIKDGILTVVIPRGTVARLTVRPMVPARYLEGSVFDPGMATLATEIRDDLYIFEGASLVIESMLGSLAVDSNNPAPWQDSLDPANGNRCYNWEDLVTKAVSVRPAGKGRSFDLLAQPEAIATEPHGWRWRQLAKVDINTQRWRFTGRPIYSWLDPTNRLPPSAVAIEQKWDNASQGRRDEIVAFETESFFDRDDADFASQTMQLNPIGTTVLQSFPWEQPSATYFRHRLTIRSRYEGALGSNQIAVQRAWGVDRETNDEDPKSGARSWIRVAMLADRTRLQLTRPQLRALIPLTTAPEVPGEDTLPATPPVLALLDERPFAHGGLADRIAAEIRTGLGYVLPSAPGVLQILDARKELGPDPRLTYTPTNIDTARAMTLRSEGPVGLTFDDDTVRAPVFANTALILHPTLMTGSGARPSSLEEHFLSVALRRYLEPAWLTDGGTTSHAVADSLWIETSDPDFVLSAENATRPIIKLTTDGGNWIVKFDPTQIDPSPSSALAPLPPLPSDPSMTLCIVQKELTNGLAFLHSPLEKGRASLSVFAVPSDDAGDAAELAGGGNQPLMMASIEWQVAPGSANLTFGNSIAQISLTSASPTTLMNWTRTGKNSELWHASDGISFEPYNANTVVARQNNNVGAFFQSTTGKPLIFEPERNRYPNPLNLHRHHALIATGNAPGIGRPVEEFKQVERFFGGTFSLPNDAQAVRFVEFETPAQPLALLPSELKNSSLGRYAVAHFDVFSLLGNNLTPPPGFSLSIRLLGGDATNKVLTELSLNLALKMKNGSSVSLSGIVITNPKPASLLRSLLLMVVTTGPTINMTCKAIYASGEVDAANVTTPSAAGTLKNVLAVELAISGLKTSSATPSEFWTDVSLLTLPASNDSDFSFNWFFTGEQTRPPAEAVAAAALLDLVEAQARIISVSPPIPIELSGMMS